MSFSCQSLYPQTLHEHVSQWAYTICYLHAVCLYHVTMYTYSITSVPTAEWRPRPHGYVFKICVFISLKTEWKYCVHTIVFKSFYPSTRKRYKWLKTLPTLHCACLESFLVFIVGHLGFFHMEVHWDWDHMINCFQKFAFSVNSTRPHETDAVVFSNLSTLESVFKSLRFHRKGYIVFIVFIIFVSTVYENASVWMGP